MLSRVIGVYAFFVLIPLVPVVLLYWFFGEQNYFNWEGISKGIVAAGPIAAYFVMVYYGKQYADLALVNFGLRSGVATDILGQWTFESETIQSGKTSTGEFSITIRNGQLTMAGILSGEDGNRFAEARSDFCFFETERDLIRVLYRVNTFDDGGTPITADCICSALLLRNSEDGRLRMKGNWYQIVGGRAVSGGVQFVKQTT